MIVTINSELESSHPDQQKNLIELNWNSSQFICYWCITLRMDYCVVLYHLNSKNWLNGLLVPESCLPVGWIELPDWARWGPLRRSRNGRPRGPVVMDVGRWCSPLRRLYAQWSTPSLLAAALIRRNDPFHRNYPIHRCLLRQMTFSCNPLRCLAVNNSFSYIKIHWFNPTLVEHFNLLSCIRMKLAVSSPNWSEICRMFNKI